MKDPCESPYLLPGRFEKENKAKIANTSRYRGGNVAFVFFAFSVVGCIVVFFYYPETKVRLSIE